MEICMSECTYYVEDATEKTFEFLPRTSWLDAVQDQDVGSLQWKLKEAQELASYLAWNYAPAAYNRLKNDFGWLTPQTSQPKASA